MDEIISYKPCAVKVHNAKLRNYLKSLFVLNKLRAIAIICSCGSTSETVSHFFFDCGRYAAHRVACEQAHWEKGEPARNHAFCSIIPFSHLLNANQSASTAINKLSTVKLTRGVCTTNTVYINNINTKHYCSSKPHNILNIEFSR
jgi:hypothetical protein